MRHAVPPAEARAPGDDFLAAFTAEALEELVDHEAAGRPSQAALAVELPPVGLEERHRCDWRRRCENTAQASRVPRLLAVYA